MKALVGGGDDRILGFTMIGAEAGEVMAAVQTAMLANLPFPSLRTSSLRTRRWRRDSGRSFRRTALGHVHSSRRKAPAVTNENLRATAQPTCGCIDSVDLRNFPTLATN